MLGRSSRLASHMRAECLSGQSLEEIYRFCSHAEKMLARKFTTLDSSEIPFSILSKFSACVRCSVNGHAFPWRPLYVSLIDISNKLIQQLSDGLCTNPVIRETAAVWIGDIPYDQDSAI